MRAFFRKYWALFVIVLVLIAIVGMSQYAETAKEHGEESASHAQATPVTQDEDGKTHHDAGQPKKPPVWAKYVAFPEGVGAWAVILTLLAIVWQSIETRASAIATADAANATYRSVAFAEAQLDMMREEKRARLDVFVEHVALEAEVAGEELIHLIATVSIRNIGATIAFIGRTSGTLIAKLRDEEFEQSSNNSPLELPERYIDPDKIVIPTKVYCFPFGMSSSAFAESLEKKAFTLHFYGFIEYESLGLWRRKDFFYEWEVISRNSFLGGLYGFSDPHPDSPRPARDRIVYGYWKLDQTRGKAEYSISGKQESEEYELPPEPRPRLWWRFVKILEKLADDNQH